MEQAIVDVIARVGRLKGTRVQLVLDATLIHATGNLEVATVAPGGGPAVLHQPVVNAVLCAVTYCNLDGVPAQNWAPVWCLYTPASFVVHKAVSIDGEGALNGAVVNNSFPLSV